MLENSGMCNIIGVSIISIIYTGGKLSMDVNELFNRGLELFNADRYREAIPVFQQAADAGSADAEIFVALCYLSLAGDTSLQASQSSETEALVRGQQLAVS